MESTNRKLTETESIFSPLGEQRESREQSGGWYGLRDEEKGKTAVKAYKLLVINKFPRSNVQYCDCS